MSPIRSSVVAFTQRVRSRGSMPLARLMRIAAAVLAVVGVFIAGQAHATFLLLPDIPHNRWDVIPFGLRSGDGRFQQVYAQSLFPQPVHIDSLAFSMLVNQNFTADITIKFGYTTVGPAALSPSLDNNVTSPETTVFSDHNFMQWVIGGSEAFGLVFDFSADPFFYNPKKGQNLILDISIAGKSPPPPGVGEQGVSMIPSVPSFLVGRAYDMTGFDGVNQWGARTLFGLSSPRRVPEPSALTIFLGGLLGMLLLGFLRCKPV